MSEITLLDKNYAVYGDAIKAFESLSYSDAWDKHGALSLVLGKDDFANVRGAAWLLIDGRVYENETQLKDDEKQTVKLTGSSPNVLFDRIVIKEVERLQGRLEERIRYLVNKYAITGSQRLATLSLGTDHGYVRAIDATTKRGQTLSSFLYAALNQRGFSFSIICDDTGALVFDLLRGLDRTQDQTTNIPVLLSTQDALEKASYKRSIKDYRNFAVVCDEDTDNPQTVEVDLSNGEPVRALYVRGRITSSDDAPVNLYVMVGAGGFIATSADATNWTQQTSGTTQDLYSVDYQSGNLIASGANGTVLTSQDGSTWTSAASGVSVALRGARVIDGLFIASGDAATIITSYGGAWTQRKGSGTPSIAAALAAQERLIAPSTSSALPDRYYRSDDGGGTWEEHAYGLDVYSIRAMVRGGGKLVGVGAMHDTSPFIPATVMSTDEGQTWALSQWAAKSTSRFTAIAYGLGRFVAVGQPNLIAYSLDGDNWTDCTPAGGTPDYTAIVFDGAQFHAYSATTKHHAFSADGIAFTLQALTLAATAVNAVVFGTTSYTATLQQVGVDALLDAAIVETIDGDINADLAPEYGVDYNIGDIADVVNPDDEIYATKRVLEVEFLTDKDNILAIIPKVGKDFLTLRQYIAKEIAKNA